jgi:UDP-N-acetylmuramyl tripeptide synthase
MSATKMFSQYAFQRDLVDELEAIRVNGQGGHRDRSVRAAMRRARKTLSDVGYTEEEIKVIIDDARAMYELEAFCDD